MNLRTLDGYLPDELTTNKTIRRLLQNSRKQHNTEEYVQFCSDMKIRCKDFDALNMPLLIS